MYARNKKSRSNSRCCHCKRCKELPMCPENPMLANSYVPYQEYQDIFEPAEALANGTAFPELVSPYAQNESQRKICYLESTKTCEEEVDECGEY